LGKASSQLEDHQTPNLSDFIAAVTICSILRVVTRVKMILCKEQTYTHTQRRRIAMTDAFAKRLGERFQVENAPAIFTRTLRKGVIAVTEVRCDNPLPEMSGPLRPEDAFLIGLQLRDRPSSKIWEDSRQAPMCDLRAGELILSDLKREPRRFLDKPYHTLAFYLPRAALDAIADDANAPRIGELGYKPGAGVNDVVISRLGNLLLPALSHPNQADPFFVDQVLMVFGVHINQTYGRHAAGVATDARCARALAGATGKRISSRQPSGCAAKAGGADVRCCTS
jgi:hypothetical protein